MDIRSAFTGKYLAAADIPAGREVTVTIEAVSMVDVELEAGGVQSRALVAMRAAKKGWLLNRTNAELISAMFGYETAAWAGKRVTIGRAKVKFGRDTVDGIRVIGSPDLDADRRAEVKLPRKKPQAVVLRRTGASRDATLPTDADREDPEHADPGAAVDGER
jgi:hypothetical protein